MKKERVKGDTMGMQAREGSMGDERAREAGGCSMRGEHVMGA